METARRSVSGKSPFFSGAGGPLPNPLTMPGCVNFLDCVRCLTF